MPDYDYPFLSRVAEAVAADAALVETFAPRFESAARWYRIASGDPKRIAPSITARDLKQIRANVLRLLKSLGIVNPDAADDGPPTDILDALVLTPDADEAPLVEATRRLARLAESIEGVAATRELNLRAQKAAEETSHVGQLTVERGHSGDRATNNWVAAMMVLYKEITGHEPATSVGKTGQPNEGVATGPLIRFLAAAGEPLDLQFSEDGWRSRVRTILKGAAKQN